MAMDQFGVCTWIFGSLSLEQVAGRVAALHFDGVELLGELSRPSAEIGHVLAEQGLAVFSLTPANVDLAHPEESIRSQALEYYLSLLDFAAEIGAPLISCHGAVGRIRPIGEWQPEWALMVEGVREIADHASRRGLRVAIELLNRYESHLLNNVDQGLRILDEVGASNMGLNLDAYHMNIEEPDPAGAVRRAGKRLFLFHAADSNRQSLGRGHTDWAGLWRALHDVNYAGPIILETPAPGPDPFQAIKDESSLPWVETYLRESLDRLQTLAQAG